MKTNEQLAEELAVKAFHADMNSDDGIKAAILSSIPLPELIAVARAARHVHKESGTLAVHSLSNCRRVLGEALAKLETKLPEP